MASYYRGDTHNQHTCIEKLRRLTYTENMDYELPQLVSDFWPDKLPIIMRVTVGYCGANTIDFTFASDEMYLITHVNTQNRVILKDRTGQLLSFPEDHSIKFYTLVNGVKDETPKQLCEILEEHSMSASKIELVPVSNKAIHFYAGPGQEHSMQMDLFEWETSYEERYLVGNSIAFEKLFNNPLVIPIWMPINIDVAIGVNNEPLEAFEMLMNSVKRISKNFTNSEAPGNKEVMLFEGCLSDYECAYDTIAPCDYADVGSLKQPFQLDVQTIGLDTSKVPVPSSLSESDDDDLPPPPIEPRNPIGPKSGTSNLRIPTRKVHPPGSHQKHSKDSLKLLKLINPFSGERKEKKTNKGEEKKVFSPSGESIGSPTSPDSGNKTPTLKRKVTKLFSHITKPKVSSSEVPEQSDNNNQYKSPDEGAIASPSGESFMSQRSTASVQSKENEDDIYEEELDDDGDHGNQTDEGESSDEYEVVNLVTPQKNSSGYSKTKTTCVVAPIDPLIYSNCGETEARPSGLPTVENNRQNALGSRPLPNIPSNDTTSHLLLSLPRISMGTASKSSRSLPSIPGDAAVSKVKPVVTSKPVKLTATPQGAAGGSGVMPQSSINSLEDGKAEGRPSQSANGEKTPDAKPTAKRPPVVAKKPKVKTVEASATDKPTTSKSVSEESTYASFKDLPKSLTGLSVQGVSECLKILKLSHHIDTFVEQDIDGNLLQDCDESILTDEFNFKRFEAKKMIQFISGWRPGGIE